MQWFKIRVQNNRKQVFDPIRHKFVALTPEEEVRQNTLFQLINTMKVPESLISVEYSLKLNGLQKRCDIVVFTKEGKAVMIVECKAGSVEIDQSVLEQAARYNFKLKVNYLMLTNGIKQFYCRIHSESKQLEYLGFIPDYKTICER
ncbi:MAG: type I restriction enzyme HsdR N-terminal domain-containing protein [Bacteroidales bacterium]|nr:type I restriction enzyme HsdR N-terminal domain-containing protein [Bacteroidales bacterium]